MRRRARYRPWVTLFDTAAIYGYGHSEEVLGGALGSRRSEIVLVTKGGITWDEVGGRTTRTATREVLVNGLEDSLRRLGTAGGGGRGGRVYRRCSGAATEPKRLIATLRR